MTDQVTDRLNLLLLMTDQQRWDAMGCSGGWVETPHLDRIAAQGVRFANCVTTSPICVPARISLATGRYPHNTGVWGHRDFTLPVESPTWMQAVRAAGYRTSVFGKTHLHAHVGDLRDREHLLQAYGLDDVDEIAGPRMSAHTTSHMTDRWERLGLMEAFRSDLDDRFASRPWMVRPSPLPFEEYPDVYVGRRASEYLEAYDRPEPWCCWVSFGGPHEPWDTPEPWAGRYDPAAMPAPSPAIPRGGGWPTGGLDRWIEWIGPDLDPGEVLAMRADYAANVSLIDDQIGRILEVVEQRGELAHTAIVFTSDHGEMNGDHGLIYKMNFFDGAVRVPLLLLTPDLAGSDLAGSVVEAPVEWIDVGSTMVELAGSEVDHAQFGRSLASPDQDHWRRGDALSEFEGEVMLLTDDWKIVLNDRAEPYLLFDRHNDPNEVDNRVLDPSLAGVRDDLRIRILERVLSAQVTR